MVTYKIKYNKRSKRHVVFEVPEAKGLWKILKSFPKKKEAEAYVEELKKKQKKKKQKKRKRK